MKHARRFCVLTDLPQLEIRTDTLVGMDDYLALLLALAPIVNILDTRNGSERPSGHIGGLNGGG